GTRADARRWRACYAMIVRGRCRDEPRSANRAGSGSGARTRVSWRDARNGRTDSVLPGGTRTVRRGTASRAVFETNGVQKDGEKELPTKPDGRRNQASPGAASRAEPNY